MSARVSSLKYSWSFGSGQSEEIRGKGEEIAVSTCARGVLLHCSMFDVTRDDPCNKQIHLRGNGSTP
jgi:hypothetical protein